MSSSEDNAGPVIRDRRRIDPDTGLVREPDQSGPAQTAGGTVTGQPGSGKHAAGLGDTATASAADETAAIRAQLDERTADLQRLQAEYANYRKLVERDRTAVREQALASVLTELLPVLDDIGRAREHGELSGGFKSVAESLESAVAKLGLVTYGEKGDPFDPVVHEALMHSYSDEVDLATCVRILQPGYKIGERILRPARVEVAEPGGDNSGGADDEAPEAAAGKLSDEAGSTSPDKAPADSGN
ncbi:MAG TPA: nucleotide exchange factor GrpE [Streptosporangiaceae bacterium]